MFALAATGGVMLYGRRDAFATRVGRVLDCSVRTRQKRVGPVFHVLDPYGPDGGMQSNSH